jgi:nitroimidazol reductase NimA-like FMN-containing flavoprotein (pyridoxamine 5'-phosphate oxidase superfamily)
MIDMSNSETLTLLENGRVGRIALVGPGNRPYAIPLRYVWHNKAIYVRLAFAGRKQEAIEYTRRVCFETDECRDDFSHYASVLAEGTLIDVINDDEKRDALVAMNLKYERLAGLPHPGPDPVIHGVALRKIVVDRLTGRKIEPQPSAVARPLPPRLATPVRVNLP